METANKKKIRREFIGEVVSSAMAKTIVVKVDRRALHSKYKKYFSLSRKYHVHDEKQAAKVGNKVKFAECRPLSKTKRWRLIEIISK